MTNEYSLIEFDKVSAEISMIKEKGNFIPDCSTKEGYEASKRFCLDFTVKAKRALTDAHQKTKAPFLETTRFLDEKKRELMLILDKIEEPHKLAYKGYDEEKKQKNAKFEKSIRDKIQIMIDYKAESIGKTSGEISVLLTACCQTNIESGFFHLKDEASISRQESLSVLRISMLKAKEAEEAQEKLKSMQEKYLENYYETAWLLNEKFDRDVSDKLAVQLAQKRADEQAKEKIEQEKAIEMAKQQEIERQEQEIKRIEAEAKSRAENEHHVMKIKNAAVNGVEMHCNVTEEVARSFIRAVANNLVPNVKIKY